MAYTDDQLLLLFNDQSERGYIGVYEKYWLHVYYSILHYGLTSQDAANVAAKVFSNLFDKGFRFERMQNVKAYLITACRNSVYDFLSLKEAQEGIGAQNPGEDTRDDQTVDQEVVRATLQQVMERVDNLPNPCRHIFILAFLHQWTNAQIAEALNINLNTVQRQKQKARKHFGLAIPLKNWFR